MNYQTEQQYETEIQIHLPYAVYGTLRRGFANSRLWQGLGDYKARGTVEGFRLVANGHFPYAIPSEGQAITVELLQPRIIEAEEMRDRLDRLEGFPSFYDRIIVPVVTQDGTEHEAWMYTPVDPEEYADLESVPSNDWSKY